MNRNIVFKWLSAYSPDFPRSVVYMLQATEYKIPDYLDWLLNLQTFKNLEFRKKLVKTTKAKIMFATAWVIYALPAFSLLHILLFGGSVTKFIILGLLIIFAPVLVTLGILLPLIALKYIVQKPIEKYIIREAREKLKAHKGVKIAVAGSFGKTTMREILKTVIGEGKIVAAPPENHNTLLGISSFIQGLKGDEEVLVFELGEYYQGDIKEMCELVRPDLGVITGVNEAHLDKMKFLEITTQTIFELADHLKGKTVYVNGESPLARNNASPDHIIYTREGVADMKVEKPMTSLDGTSFTIEAAAGLGGLASKSCSINSGLLGLHQIGPLMAAIHIAKDLDIPMFKIIHGVEKTKAFDHRLRKMVDKNGVIILDDSYNGNPDGVRAVINFLAVLVGHRRFYVTPGLVEMGERVEAVHLEIGRELARAKIEKVILIENSVTKFIAEGLKQEGYDGEVTFFENGPKAFQALPYLTVAGDVVLLQNDWPDQYY